MRLAHCNAAFDEVDLMCVNDSLIFASYSEVVSDKFYGSFLCGCHHRRLWSVELGISSFIAPVLVLVSALIIVFVSVMLWVHLVLVQ